MIPGKVRIILARHKRIYEEKLFIKTRGFVRGVGSYRRYDGGLFVEYGFDGRSRNASYAPGRRFRKPRRQSSGRRLRRQIKTDKYTAAKKLYVSSPPFRHKNFAENRDFHYIYIIDSVKICLQTQKISV